MWFFAAAFIIGFILTAFFGPKPNIENARAAKLSDFNFPRSKEGDPVPRIYGTVKSLGVNTIGTCNFNPKPIKQKVKTGLFSSKHEIVGYQYYIGLDAAVCLGPGVVLRRIWYGKNLIYAGCNYRNGCELREFIDLPNLLGGKQQNGGIKGWIAFYCGDFDQTANAYLQTNLATDGDTFPSYPGICHMVFEDFYWGNSANIDAIAVEVSAFLNTLQLVDEKHVMPNGLDMNPIAVLYDLYVNDWGGLGVTDPIFNLENWRNVAYQVYDEGNGFSVEIANANSGADVSKEILRQINATIYTDPSTGEINIVLMRQNYDIATLPVLGPDEISSLNNFTKKLWKDTFNRVRIAYKDRNNDYNDAIATADDFGNIRYQGRMKATDVSYPGVYDGALANTLAARDLSNLSVPLYQGDLTLNRTHTDLLPGSVFVLQWPEYNIAGIVVRVQKMSLGQRKDGKVTMSVVQDEFASDAIVFGAPTGAGLTDGRATNDPATAILVRTIKECPYFLAQADGIAVSSTQSLIMVAATAPTPTTDQFDVYTSIDGGTTYNQSGDDITFGTIGTLATAIAATDDIATGLIPALTINVADASDLAAHTSAEVAQGANMLLIDNELFAFESLVVGSGTITIGNVWRSLLDTSPANHAIGAGVYFLGGGNVVDDLFNGDARVDVKLAPKTYGDTLDYTTDTATTLALLNRCNRPLPPAAIKFGAGAFFAPPTDGTTNQVITWANRDRTATKLRQLADATSEYEAGQRTTIRWRKNAGAWTAVTFAPGIKTATIDTGSVAADVIDWEIYATGANGLDSFAKWQFTSGAASATGSSPETSVASGGGAPSTPADTTGDYVTPIDGVTLVFPFGKTIGTDQIDLPITFGVDIAANLVGTVVDMWVHPAAAQTFTLNKITGGVSTAVGTVQIATSGAITLTAATAFSLKAGDTLSCQPPASADTALAGLTISVAATRTPS